MPTSGWPTCAPPCGWCGAERGSRRHDGRRIDKPQARAGRAGAAGRSSRRCGRELRAVLERRRRGRAMPVRRRGRRDQVRPRAGRRVRVAGLPARRRAGPALRLPRPRAVGSRRRGRAAIRPSCCSTRTPARSPARCGGIRRCSGTCPTIPTAPTAPTRRRTSRARWWSPASSTGATTDRRRARWRTRSSTRSTSRASPSSTPTCPSNCAARTPAWRTRPRSTHLKRLGVTAVELLPVHQFVHDAQLVARGLRNYWGYQSIGYFAPHNGYASSGDGGGQVDEFRRDGPRAARGRARGDPRRGVQPHRGGRASGVRRCASAGSTTPPTTGSPTTGLATSTTPAAATRSTCTSRSRCGW